MRPGTQISCSQGVQPDHVQVKISSCSFPRDLVSFDPWYMTYSDLEMFLSWEVEQIHLSVDLVHDCVSWTLAIKIKRTEYSGTLINIK